MLPFNRFRWFTWGEVILLLVYALVVAVCILFARPRLLIYNATIEQVRPLVAQNAAVDPAVRWAERVLPCQRLGYRPTGGKRPIAYR